MLTRRHSTVVLTASLLLMSAGVARAQYGGGNIGVKMDDTNVLHVGVAAEAGWDTNVFYGDETNQRGSALFRVIPSILVTNNGRDGQARSGIVYQLGANLVYREYISDDPNVRNQRAFVPSVMASLAMNGAKTTFSISDQFTRTEEAPYVATGPSIIRDSNQGVIGFGFSPGGGRLTTSLRYTNGLDYFETEQYKYASHMSHDGMLDVAWKWLPKTALFGQVGGGYVHYLHANDPNVIAPERRENSYPLRGTLGIRGLLTAKTTVNLAAGYQTAFYEASDSPSGFSNVYFAGQVGYLPTLLSRVTLGLFHGFRNSPVIGSFYDVDSVTLAGAYALGRLVASTEGAYEYRRYRDHALNIGGMLMPISRRDHVLSGKASLDFYIQKWLFGGASYAIGLNQPLDSATPGAVKYLKHQVFARLGVTY